MTRVFLLLLLAICTLEAAAQSGPRARNTIYFELLGSGGIYSFKYDRSLYHADDQPLKLVVQGGLSWAPLPEKEWYLSVPLRAMHLLGKGSLKGELGINVTYAIHGAKEPEPETRHVLFPGLGIGIRKARQGKGITWRAGGMLSFNGFWFEPDSKPQSVNAVLVWPGVAIGYAF